MMTATLLRLVLAGAALSSCATEPGRFGIASAYNIEHQAAYVDGRIMEGGSATKGLLAVDHYHKGMTDSPTWISGDYNDNNQITKAERPK